MSSMQGTVPQNKVEAPKMRSKSNDMSSKAKTQSLLSDVYRNSIEVATAQFL